MTDLDDQGPVRVPRFGLSGKLLILTILFVMIVQVLIYVPSVSTFRLNWLNDRLAAARTAALVLYAAPSGMVPDDLARDILSSIGAQAVVMKTGQTRRVYQAAREPKSLLVISGADHNDDSLLSGREMIDGIIHFLRRLPTT